MSPPLAWKMALVAVAQIFFLLAMCRQSAIFSLRSVSLVPRNARLPFPYTMSSWVWSSLITCAFFFLICLLINKTSRNIFPLARACSIKNKFLCPRFQSRMLQHGEKKCVCWFKNNGKKQHKGPQVSSHLSCKTSADRTVREFFHYPLNSPEDDYKKQPEEHGNHCSANEDNELQICFLFSAWEEINEYLSDSWKRIGFVHSLK